MNLLIIGAVVLVIADAVVLAIGWSSANEPLIFTSIGASVLAFLLVSIAWFKDRRRQRRPVVVDRVGPTTTAKGMRSAAAGKTTRPAGETSSWARGERRPAQPAPPVAVAEEAPEETIAPAAAVAVTKKKPAGRAKKTATRKSAATVGGAAATTSSRASKGPADTAAVAASDDVIAVPDRKRFHRRDCRFATAKGAERMSKASARRRGYAACGICKP
ncbi:MAG TPA: hypothetical protein VNC78_04180 [Actinomycetota bacterium]|nr:hypothetical protein [Actinomycetota bacterium]